MNPLQCECGGKIGACLRRLSGSTRAETTDAAIRVSFGHLSNCPLDQMEILFIILFVNVNRSM